MKTIKQYLTKAVEKASGGNITRNWTAFAREMGISQGCANRYSKGRIPEAEILVKIARYIDVLPIILLTLAEYEKATDKDVKAAWAFILKLHWGDKLK